MSNVTRLRHALPMSQDIHKALTDLDSAIAKAIDEADCLKASLLPRFTAMLTHKPTSW